MQPITLISSNYDLFVLNRKWQQLHHFCLHTLSQDWEDPDYGVSMNDRMGKTFDGQTDKLFWELDIWPAVKCFQHLGSFLWGQHSQHCEPLLKFGPGCIECSEPGKRLVNHFVMNWSSLSTSSGNHLAPIYCFNNEYIDRVSYFHQ